MQQVIVWVLVGLAALYVARAVWSEVRGLLHPEEAGGCPGCGECDAAKAVKAAQARARKGVRPAPEIKSTPLVTLQRPKKDGD